MQMLAPASPFPFTPHLPGFDAPSNPNPRGSRPFPEHPHPSAASPCPAAPRVGLGAQTRPSRDQPGTIHHMSLLLGTPLSTRIPAQAPRPPWAGARRALGCLVWAGDPPAVLLRGCWGEQGASGGQQEPPGMLQLGTGPAKAPRCFMYQTVIRSKGQRGGQGALINYLPAC